MQIELLQQIVIKQIEATKDIQLLDLISQLLLFESR